MFCSPVFSEEQYEYVQSEAPAGCMESKRVEKAAKPKSVDVNRLSIVKSRVVDRGVCRQTSKFAQDSGCHSAT